jgi:hypothetical protein
MILDITRHETLKNTNDKIKYVVHIADIHVHKTNDRHDEYMLVFNRLCDDLVSKGYNNSNSVIVCCGDVFHDKHQLSPYSVGCVKEFATMLNKITDLIVITGNHDLNMNNSEDLDSLSVTIGKNFSAGKDIQNKVYVLKDEGHYEYQNICFSMTSMFSTEVLKCDIETDKIKIALFHGTLNKSVTFYGHEFNNDIEKKYFKVSDFDEIYDFTLLGDIHKFQKMSDKCVYAGSLIQQDRGESLDNHGYVLLDLEKKTFEMNEIKNDYGLINAIIEKNGDITMPKNLPQNLDIKIINKCDNNNNEQLNKIYEDLNNLGIIVTKKQEYNDYTDKGFNNKIKINNNELINMENNEHVINNIMNSMEDENISNEIKDMLRTKIMDMLINDIKYNYSCECKKIELIELKFDNVLIYGEGNYIDFNKKFNGFVCLSSDNYSGKSCLIDAILLSIYGECERVQTKGNCINFNKEYCDTKITLKVNDDIFTILRHIKHKNKTNSVTETIKIFKNDKNVSRGDLTISKKYINENICLYEDLLLTSIVLQNNELNFINMKSNDRKKFLCKMANINIFTKIVDATKSRIRVCGMVKKNTINEIEKKYSEYYENAMIINNIENNINAKIKNINANINENDKKIIELNNENNILINKKYINDNKIGDIKIIQNMEKKYNIVSIDDIINKIEQNKCDIDKLITEKNIINSTNNDLIEEQKKYNKEKNENNIKNITNNFIIGKILKEDKIDKYINELNNYKNKIEINEKIMRELTDKIKKFNKKRVITCDTLFDNIEYEKNKNNIVKYANDIKNYIKDYENCLIQKKNCEETIKYINDPNDEIKKYINNIKNYKKEYEKYVRYNCENSKDQMNCTKDLKDEMEKLKRQIFNVDIKNIKTKKEVDNAKEKINVLKKKIINLKYEVNEETSEMYKKEYDEYNEKMKKFNFNKNKINEFEDDNKIINIS